MADGRPGPVTVASARGVRGDDPALDPAWLYVGRAIPRRGWAGSPWSNPFWPEPGRIGFDRRRVDPAWFRARLDAGVADCVSLYDAWLDTRPELLARLGELAGRVLVCWCGEWRPGGPPIGCHAEALARRVNALLDTAREGEPLPLGRPAGEHPCPKASLFAGAQARIAARERERQNPPRLALTLRHPWPWAIVALGKDVENRGWRPGARLEAGFDFAIHGGKMPGRGDLAAVAAEARGLVERFGHRLPPLRQVTLRDAIVEGVVAVARFGGCVEASDSPWFEGPVGWVLEDVRVLTEPVPCKGAQGLWEMPPDVAAEVRQRLATAVYVLARPQGGFP